MLGRRDTLAVLPTGLGKSLIYQLGGVAQPRDDGAEPQVVQRGDLVALRAISGDTTTVGPSSRSAAS